MLTGLQPSGKLHVGNYLGTGANLWREYQDQYQCYFFIADLHSLTGNYTPQEKKAEIINLAAEILSFGLDTEKCVLFQQSEIREHTELTWYLNCLTPIAFLERMTQYKDKASRQKENIKLPDSCWKYSWSLNIP